MVRGIWETHNRVLAMKTAEPEAGFRELGRGIQATLAYVGSRGDEIWLQTDFQAPRGRVIALRWGSPDKDPREIVPEQADATIDTWVGARGAGEGIVVGYRKDSRLYFDYVGADGNMLKRIEPPNMSSVWTGLVGRQGSDTVFFTVSSFADPGSVYRLKLHSGEQTLFQQPELPYDPQKIVVEQRFYRGEGRERVPMFVAYHEETPPDGSRPVMMYGYGFGAWIAAPWFRPHLPEWFLSGGTFVLPALRGGGEFGEEWHRAGAVTGKTASIDDFIAAAEWLIDAGIARQSLLVAETNSAGGPVVGASIVRRPDLFGAAILSFPLLDMLAYENYTHAGRWRSELGSVQNPEESAALASYSPPHNVTPGTCYPPVLLAPGALDEVTPPMHAYKFAAALQHAGNCDNPALLRMSWDAGHAYGGTPEETAATLAAQLVFLRKVLDLKP
jgi:prolyl oligopeptidase